MDDFRGSLPYQDGYVALTDTHLVVVHRNAVTENLAFAHFGNVRAEQAHSFRHRVWGIVCAAVLLVPSLAALVAGATNPAAWGIFKDKLRFAALFGIFFGLLFFWGVWRSRRIWWLHVGYGKATKNIPLPGVEESELERFMEVLMHSARNSHGN